MVEQISEMKMFHRGIIQQLQNKFKKLGEYCTYDEETFSTKCPDFGMDEMEDIVLLAKVEKILDETL